MELTINHNENHAFHNSDEKQSLITENPNKLRIIDQIQNKYGYSSLVWINILSTFMVLFIEDIEMTYFSYLLIPYKKLLNLSTTDIIFIHATFYLGSTVASTSAAYITKYLSRRTTLNGAILILLLCHIGSAFVNNVVLFCVLRFINGYSVGVMDIIAITVFIEYLPMKLRAFSATSIWIAFSISPTIFLIIMMIYMPDLEASKIEGLLLITASFPAICLIYNLIFFTDSPRSFILRGQEKEAIKILEIMNGKQISKEDKKKLVEEITLNSNTEVEGSLKDLYSSKYLSTTLILGFVWLSSGIVCYGVLLISSLTMKSTNITANDIIRNEIFIRLPSALSYLVGAPLCEVKFISRKTLIIILNSISLFFMILCLFTTGALFSWMLGISFAINFLNLNVINTYACEIFPTKIRDHIVGALFTASNLGAIISLITIPLHEWNILVPYYFSSALFLLSTILLFFLPIESIGECLDNE